MEWSGVEGRGRGERGRGGQVSTLSKSILDESLKFNDFRQHLKSHPFGVCWRLPQHIRMNFQNLFRH